MTEFSMLDIARGHCSVGVGAYENSHRKLPKIYWDIQKTRAGERIELWEVRWGAKGRYGKVDLHGC